MHELSVAVNIIDICQAITSDEINNVAEKIVIEIGELACIEIHSLLIALVEASKYTAFENTLFVIERKPGTALCLICTNNFNLKDMYTLCPKCGSYQIDILEGKDIIIKSIELT